ncbi:hypothetical protein ACRAWF_05255 [Streptomyces sp. L7]
MPVPGEGLYGSSKTAPRYAVQVLAQELADRGVTVNTILPTAIEGRGRLHRAEPGPPGPAVRRRPAWAHRPPDGHGRRRSADAAEYFASSRGLGQRTEPAGQRRAHSGRRRRPPEVRPGFRSFRPSGADAES